MNLQKFYIFHLGVENEFTKNSQNLYSFLSIRHLKNICPSTFNSQLPPHMATPNWLRQRCSHPAWQLLIPHSSFFAPYPFATNAPLILCHTLKMAPGMVAKGAEAKWRVANEQASPLFCMPTSMLMAVRLA